MAVKGAARADERSPEGPRRRAEEGPRGRAPARPAAPHGVAALVGWWVVLILFVMGVGALVTGWSLTGQVAPAGLGGAGEGSPRIWLRVVVPYAGTAILLCAFLLVMGRRLARTLRGAPSPAALDEGLAERLVRMEGTLRPLVEMMGDAVIGLDGEERITSWNSAAREILGHEAARIIGRPYGLLLPSGGGDHAAFVRQVRERGAVADVRATRRAADGREVPVSISRFVVRDGAGRPAGMVEILRDISERQKVQRELLTAEKMAAVGKMASKVVHEIRNPLAAFNLNVDLLSDSLKELPPAQAQEAEEILENLKRETRRLRQITEEYLQFSRLPRKQFRHDDVNEMLLEMADFARPELRRKGIRILLRLDEGRPRAYFDAGLLRQACLNLVRNAMEAAKPEGHIRLASQDLGDRVEIRVADDGCGIREEDLPHIFEPFFTTKKDGTGLGLSVVRQIVDEHGGRVQVRSLWGRGTTFIIHLPKSPPGGGAGEEQRDQAAFSDGSRSIRDSTPSRRTRCEARVCRRFWSVPSICRIPLRRGGTSGMPRTA